MHVQRLLSLSLLSIALLWSSNCPAVDPAEATAEPSSAPSAEAIWLDEVKAQREAWEHRRHAAKEAAEMRRRHLDPWGSARLDAQERSSEARRQQARQHIEQQRQSAEAQMDANRQAMDKFWREREQLLQGYRPNGWNNPWYYRGY
jgi:hypothetical protein